jgi:hypothetical protein
MNSLLEQLFINTESRLAQNQCLFGKISNGNVMWNNHVTMVFRSVLHILLEYLAYSWMHLLHLREFSCKVVFGAR